MDPHRPMSATELELFLGNVQHHPPETEERSPGTQQERMKGEKIPILSSPLGLPAPLSALPGLVTFAERKGK